MKLRRTLAVLLLLPLGLPGAAFAAAEIDWTQYAEVDTVVVVTKKEEGGHRDTTIWLLVLDGQGYVRTGGGRWGKDLQRDPHLSMKVGDEALQLSAEFIEDEELRARVIEGFGEKYGFMNSVVGLLSSSPLIMRLHPRSAE